MRTEKAIGVVAFPEDDRTPYRPYATKDGSVLVQLKEEIASGATVATDGKWVTFLGGESEKPRADMPGMAGFQLTFEEDAKYLVWVRYFSAKPTSVWLDYGAAEYRTHERGYMRICLPGCSEEEFQWKQIGTVKKYAGETAKIRLRTCEEGCRLDKIVFTKALAWKPEGDGVLPNAQEANLLGKVPSNLYPAPPVTPPPEHPRVLFRAADIPKIRKNMESPEIAELVSVFHNLKDRDYDGHLQPKDPNDDPEGLEVIAAKAADYALFGNERNGYRAIEAIKNYAFELDVQSAGDNCRQKGHAIKILGQVYDWCYPLLSEEDKHDLMYLAQMISIDMEIGFPPDGQTIICGHGSENQIYRDWLTMAIAAYDEYPDAYNMVAGKVYSPESLDYRNWWNQSGTHSQGSSYPLEIRYKAELFAHILIKRMCGAELFNEKNLTDIAYEWIYRRRPDGMIMIDGDDVWPNRTKKGTYATPARDVMFLASVLNGSPVLKREFFLEGGFAPEYHRVAVQPIDMLVLNDPGIDTDVPLDTLPHTRYYGSPVGEMVARTGWGEDSVIATMQISEYNPMNHGHYDCGHFMIYYKGILANDSGWYEKHGSAHHSSYMSQTVAHNSLLIGTPYNKWGNQNQGIDGPEKTNIDRPDGKNFWWIDDTWKAYQENKANHWAEVIGHEFGPEYAYLAGDLALAYTSDYDDGVNQVLRHMIFLPTADAKHPAVFVVFDKIDTKCGGYKKAFLLHSEEEPEVYGNVTVIKRTEGTYNGKLINQTLLPKAARLEKIGGTGKRFWNKDRNWPFIQDDPTIKVTADTVNRRVNPDNSLEAGWGRVEISPESTNEVDYLLNVMYVCDADENAPMKTATLIETVSFAGAKMLNRVVLFPKKKERTEETVVFSVSGSEEMLKIHVAGLAAGTWSIRVNEKEFGTQSVSAEGGMLCFTAPVGTYELTYKRERRA